MERMVTATAQLQIAFALGELPLGAVGAADNVVNEKFFTGLQQLHPTLSYIYFGFTNGDLVSGFDLIVTITK